MQAKKVVLLLLSLCIVRSEIQRQGQSNKESIPQGSIVEKDNTQLQKTRIRDSLTLKNESLVKTPISSASPMERELKQLNPSPPKKERKLLIDSIIKKSNRRKKRKKKKKKDSPLSPPSPPKLPKIPKLVRIKKRKRRRKKDLLDKLPPVLDKYKYHKVGDQKYMIIPKYRPIKTYLKKHDKETKEYSNTDKYSAVDSQLATMLPITYGTPGKKQRAMAFNALLKGGDNPRFSKDMHADLELDYFKLTFPYLDRRFDRLKQIQSYVKKWMAVDPTSEDVEIKYYKEGGLEVYNQVVVSYFNRKFYKKKRYIIEFTFAIEKVLKKKILKLAKIVRATPPKSKYYEKNYEFTIRYKCGVIRKRLLNPKIFRCHPVINSQDYILNNTFIVDTVLYQKMYKGLLFSFDARKRVMAKRLYPNPINAMTEPIGDAKEMIIRRLDILKYKFKRYKKDMVKILEYPNFKAAFGNLDADIKQYKMYYNSQVMLGEKQYQKDLVTDLWNVQKQFYTHLEWVVKNYEIMNQKNEEANVYTIDQETLKMRSRLETIQNAHTYVVKRRRFVLEEHVREILNFLDYIAYVRDRKFENLFFNP